MTGRSLAALEVYLKSGRPLALLRGEVFVEVRVVKP